MDFPPDQSRDKKFSRSGNNSAEESFPSHAVSPFLYYIIGISSFVNDHVVLNWISSYDIACQNTTSHDIAKITEPKRWIITILIKFNKLFIIIFLHFSENIKFGIYHK